MLRLLPLLFLLACQLIKAQLLPPASPSAAFVGAGVAYNPSTSPKAVGHVWFALLADRSTCTYSWTAVDLLYSRSASPTRLTTAVEAGAAQWLRDFGRVGLYMLGAAGAAVSTASVGGAFSGGGMLVVPLKGGLALGLNVRVIQLTGPLNQSQTSAGIDIIWGR